MLSSEEKNRALIEIDRVLKFDGLLVIGDFMFENDIQKQELIQRFKSEKRIDMLEEIEDEEFTMIDKTNNFLQKLGY
jgi:ubiquinone/menaquinone biosynthesis C-methylase UbiE